MPLRVSTDTGDVPLPKSAHVATDATTPEPHDGVIANVGGDNAGLGIDRHLLRRDSVQYRVARRTAGAVRAELAAGAVVVEVTHPKIGLLGRLDEYEPVSTHREMSRTDAPGEA